MSGDGVGRGKSAARRSSGTRNTPCRFQNHAFPARHYLGVAAKTGAQLSFLQPLISTGLQPGVRVVVRGKPFQRLPGAAFVERAKTVETVSALATHHTRLKPGANECLAGNA